MNKIFESINCVLADWNPLCVPIHLATEEYKCYIPMILKSIEDPKLLLLCLEDILISHMEIDYDNRNEEHVEDLHQVCEKLFQVYKNSSKL